MAMCRNFNDIAERIIAKERVIEMIATTVQNVGNLQGISIPAYLLTALNWRLGDKLVIDAKDDCLIIKHARASNRKSINDLFEGFKGDYVPHEIDWGKAEGREVW